MQQLAQDIKNQTFKQVYLLYGEEHYLRKQYRDKLKEVLIPADDTMNYHYFEGKDINVGEIIDLAETLPFLRISVLFLLKIPDYANRVAKDLQNIYWHLLSLLLL